MLLSSLQRNPALARHKEIMIEIAIWIILGLFILVTGYAVVSGRVKEVTLELVPLSFSVRISVKLVNHN